MNDSQLLALYRSAEALVFASVYEGFGLPILEAMAAGTPVVALPLSSVPEVGGDAVLYADGTSALDLARALERVATDRALRRAARPRAAPGGQVPLGAYGPAHARGVSFGHLPPFRAIVAGSASSP